MVNIVILKKKVRFYFKNLKIRYKLLAFIGAVILIFISAIGYVSYKKAEDIINTKSAESIIQTFNQCNTNIDYKLWYYENMINTIYADNNFKKLLSAPYDDEYDWLIGQKEIENYSVSMLARSKENPMMRIYTYNNTISVPKESKGLFQSLSNIVNSNWYDSIATSKGSGQYWGIVYKSIDVSLPIRHIKPTANSQNSDFTIFVSKLITDSFNVNESIAIVNIEMKLNKFFVALKEVNLGNKGYFFLMDENCKIIYSPVNSLIGNDLSSKGYINSIKKKSSGYLKTIVEDVPSVLIFDETNRLGWKLVGVLPENEITGQSTTIKNYIIILSVVLILILLLILYIYINLVTQRILLLTKAMKKFGQGDFNVETSIDGNDEIGEMNKVFKYMTGQIKNLIEQNIDAHTKQQKLELKALQEQINPHLLYNTLSTIKSMAIDIDAYDISRLVSSLSSFYKLTLSDGKDMISVYDEIQHVKNYMDILKIRFTDRLHVLYEIEENAYKYYVPKLILQPFFENCIIHGFSKKESSGSIVLEVRIQENSLVFRVIDDGIGIQKELISKIMKTDSSGYAVKNVDTRIRLYFGNDYGVNIESEFGIGTVVTISTPLISEKERPQEYMGVELKVRGSNYND